MTLTQSADRRSFRRPTPKAALARPSRAAQPMLVSRPCRCPDHDPAFVRWLQESLNRTRNLRLPLDGVLGRETRSALRAALESCGAPGSAPTETGEPAEELFLSNLFDTVSSRARQGMDYVKSYYGGSSSPGAAPAPPARPAAPSGETRFAVAEADILKVLSRFRDFTYDLHSPRYPFPLPGVSLPLAPPNVTNCCCCVEGVIVGAWSGRHGSAFQWNSTRHGQMMILSLATRFSPIDAVIGAEMGTAVTDLTRLPPWCVAQGWRSNTGGHTFLVVAHHAPSDRVLTCEANDSYRLNGVGFRNFGNLRDYPDGRPPPRWWEDARAPTWSALKAAYGTGIKLAKLNVYGVSWAGV